MRRNRDFGTGKSYQMSSGGPLMTNHLRDLDMELELLKRKRDIIEQEHAMLTRYPPKESFRQYDYQDGPNIYDRQGRSNNNFNSKSIYNRFEGSSGGSGMSRPQGIKRQSPNKNWQGPGQKRFATPAKINPWQTFDTHDQVSNRKNFQSAQSALIPQLRPLMSIRPSIGQRIQKNPPPRKDFKPSRVTKAKNQQPQKRTTNGETKKLVAQAATVAKKADPDSILRADQIPSVQVKGRMELALGTLMKEIKTEYCTGPEDFNFFHTPFIQRVLKQIIRTRIRNVMLDQSVGHVSDVLLRYRKKFPKQTDLDLVKIAQDAQSLSSKRVGVAQLIETDDPQDFYKKNMFKVLSSKFEEMLLHLEKLYMKPRKDWNDYLDKIPEPKVPEEETAQPNGTVNEVPAGEIPAPKDATDKDSAPKDPAVEETAVKEPAAEDPKATEPADEEPKAKEPAAENSEAKEASAKDPAANDTAAKVPAPNNHAVKDRVTYDNVIGECENPKEFIEKLDKVKLYIDFMDKLIEERLPKILPKFKDLLLSMVYTDQEFLSMNSILSTQMKKKFLKTIEKEPAQAIQLDEQFADDLTFTSPEKPTVTIKKEITESKPAKPANETNNVSTENVEVKKPNLPTASTPKKPINTSAAATPKTPSSEMLFAKLISRPTLPARAVIYDFLNQFKPASIKKHKTINNLLIIGFTNKEDYDKILEVNETTLGDATISIKSSEQVNKTPVSTPTAAKTGTPKMDEDILGQIDDLLSSIRKDSPGEKADSSKDISDSNGATEKTNGNIETADNSNEKTEKMDTDNAENGENINTDEKTSNDDKNEEAIDDDDKNNAKLEEDKNENNDGKPKTPEKVKDLKESGRNTPTRSSSRLANVTPSTIRTRRASRMTQNN